MSVRDERVSGTTAAADPPSYTIRSVHDFLMVPEDRHEVCLREFKVWLSMANAMQDLMEGIPIGLPEAFVWIDDGKHEIDVALVGGGERIQVANGRMREFSGE